MFDHLLMQEANSAERSGGWECWTLLSALAAATSRVELGTVVTCTGFRHPGVLAKMAHTAHELSGGRVILGLGAGWHQPEYDAFGFPFDHRFSRFSEALTTSSRTCCVAEAARWLGATTQPWTRRCCRRRRCHRHPSSSARGAPRCWS